MKNSQKVGWRKWFKRTVKWLGVALTGLILLVGLAVCLALAFPQHVLPIVNSEIEKALPGALSLDRVSKITWDGASGVDLVLRDPDGEIVARAYDVSVKTSWHELIREIFSNDEALIIAADSIVIPALHVDLGTTPDGELRLVHALVSSEVSESPSSTSVLLDFAQIQIGHAWVYGSIEGMPLDAQVGELSATLSLDEASLNITQFTTSVQVRSPEVTTQSIQVEGHCDIHLPQHVQKLGILESESAKLSLNAEATLISEGATIEALFSLRGDQMQLQASGTVPPELAALLIPHTSPPTEFTTSAQGTLADFTTQVLLKNGDAQLAVDANIQTVGSLKLHGRAQVKEFDGSLFDLPELAHLDVDLKFNAERSDALAKELDRWRVTVEGPVQRVRLQEEELPPFFLKAEYKDRIARASIETKGNAPSSQAEVTTILSPNGVESIHAKGSVHAQLLSAYVPDFKARGVVSFDADLAKDMNTLKAKLSGDLGDVQAQVFKASHLAFTGNVSGPISDPRVQVHLRVQDARLSGRRLQNAEATLSGTLSSSRVRAEGIFEGRDIEVAANLGVNAGDLWVADARLSVSDGKNSSSLSVESLRVEANRVLFSHVRLKGLGTSDLSGHWSKRSVRLKGTVRDAPLQKIAELASVKLPLSGLIDLDADFSAKNGTSEGQMRLAVARLKLDDEVLKRAVPEADFQLSLIGEGQYLATDLNAKLRDSKSSKHSSAIDLQGRLHTPSVWHRLPPGPLEKHVVSLEGRLDLEAAQIFQLTGQAGTAEGRVAAQFEAKLRQGSVIPELDARIETSKLALTIPRVDSGKNTTFTRLEGLDLQITVRHDPVTGQSEGRVAFLQKGTQVGLMEAELEGSLAPLLTKRQEALASAPLSIRLTIPPSQLETLPELVRPHGIVGDVALTVEMNGTMKQPKLKAEATFENLGPDSMLTNESLRLSGTAWGEYDGKQLVWKARAQSDQGAKVYSTGELGAPFNAHTLRPTVNELSTTLTVKSFPLESIQSLAQQQVRGTVDLEMAVDAWGTTREKVNTELTLMNVTVGDLEPAQGHVRADLEQGKVQGSLQLSGKNYTLSGGGETSLVREGMWGVEVGDAQRGSIEAKGIPLQLLQAAVGSQVAGISGKADLHLKAQSTGDGANITAKFKLKDGAFQIPSLGQQLRDIDLEARWRDGEIVVDKASFSGSSGRGTLQAKAKMKNLTPLSASIRLKIERNNRIPVSLFGMGSGELWGEIQSDADFDHDKQRATVSTRFEKFHLWFPELPTQSVQSLEPPEHIKVGVVMKTNEFYSVPLQPVKKQKEATTPWTVHAKFDLGKEFWLEQGPSRRIQIKGSAEVKVADEVRVHGKLALARGKFELNGRAFEVHRGTITFQPDEPDNPLVVLEARWYSQEGVTVIASFTGPVKSGTLSLTSDPPLREDQVVSLLLFGDTSGLGEGAVSGDSNSANQAAVVGGSLASSGLNQALGRFKAVDLSTRVRGEEGNVRPEVVVQLTNSLSAQLGYNLEEPSPGKSPDRTLLTFEARLVGGGSISATVGDQGSSLVNWVWRHRY